MATVKAVTAAAAMVGGARESFLYSFIFISFTSVFNNSDVLLFLIRIHNTSVRRLCGEKAKRKLMMEEELGWSRRGRQLRRPWRNTRRRGR